MDIEHPLNLSVDTDAEVEEDVMRGDGGQIM